MPLKRNAGHDHAFIFLNGFYHPGDGKLAWRILREMKRQPLIIAVDGGLSFLQKAEIRPDIWLSDLDSAPRIQKGFLKETQIYIFPGEKDKTDAELALDICYHRKIRAATIFGWYDRDDETDHLLGNLLLGSKVAGVPGKIDLEFTGEKQRIFPLCNGRLIIVKSRGRRLSVIPLNKCMTLTLSGVKYPAQNLKFSVGDTIALRNKIVKDRAIVTVSGSILVVIGG